MDTQKIPLEECAFALYIWSFTNYVDIFYIISVDKNSTYLDSMRSLNTQYMTNPTVAYPVKMEYGCNLSMFGLKMMVKSIINPFGSFLWDIQRCAPNNSNETHTFMCLGRAGRPLKFKYEI